MKQVMLGTSYVGKKRLELQGLNFRLKNPLIHFKARNERLNFRLKISQNQFEV